MDSLRGTAKANYQLGFKNGYQKARRECRPMLHFETPNNDGEIGT